jgi:autotransporter-associated beta strand protein
MAYSATNSGFQWTQGASWSTGTAPNATRAAYLASGTVTGDINATVFDGGTGTASVYGITSAYSAGTFNIYSVNSGRGLAIGAGGITMESSAAALNIGTDGNRFTIILNGTQTWRNDSQSLLTLSRAGSGASTTYLDTFAAGPGSQLTIAGSGAVLISREIRGGAGREISLVKQDSGLLRLSTSNAFSGGLTLQGGTLRLEDNFALGTGTFTITGGSIDVNANRTITNRMNWNGDFAFIGTSGSMVNSGAVTLGGAGPARRVQVTGSMVSLTGTVSGTLGLTKAGAGTLLVTTGSYTGATVIDAGTLQIGSGATAGSLSTSSAISGSVGATLAFNRTGIVTQGSQFSDAPITGGLGLTQLASGTLVLNAANTYTGPTTLAAGAIEANNSQALGVGGDITFTGGRLRYTGSTAGIDFGSRVKNSTSGILLDLNGNNVTLSDIDASNVGGIPAWLGTTGTLTLAGVNSYSGNTVLDTTRQLNINSNTAIGSGTLVVNGNGSLANTSGSPVSIANNMNLSGGSPTYLGTTSAMLTIAGTTTLSGAGRTITVSAGTLALGPLANSGGSWNLTKAGAGGTLILLNDADPSFTAQLIANGGNVILRSSNPLPSGTMTFSGGTVIGEAPAGISFPRARLTGGTIVSGTNSMTIGDFVAAPAANSTLTTSLSGGARLTVTGTTTVGAGFIFGVDGTADTYLLGPVVETGAGGRLTKNQAGTLFLLGTNSFSGGIRVTGGNVVLGNNSALGSGTLAISAGNISATTDVTFPNMLGLEGTTAAITGSSNITFRSVMSQGSTVGGRTLTNNLDAGKTLTFSGTTFLQDTGTNVGRVLTVSGANSRTVFDGPILNGSNNASPSGLTINAPGGLVTLNGVNTHSGTTTLTNGTVAFASNTSAFGSSAIAPGGGAISSTGSTTLTNRLLFQIAATPLTYAGPGELYFTATGTLQQTATLPVLSGTLSLASMAGGASITKTGDGTLLLSGSMGTTSFAMEDGVVRLVGSGSFSSSNPPAIRRGTFDYNGASRTVGNLTLGSATLASGTAALLTGSGTLTIKAGANDTILTLTSGSVAGFVSGNVILNQGGSGENSFLEVGEVTNAAPDLVISANLASTTTGGGLAALSKRGVGTVALSGSNSYRALQIQDGVVRIDNDAALVTSATLQLSGNASTESILGLNTATPFTRALGTGTGQVYVGDVGGIGARGFAGYGNTTRIVNLGNSGAPVTWASTNFLPSFGGNNGATFVLGAADADGTLDFQNGINLAGSGTMMRMIKANNGSAAVDGILSGVLTGSAGILKLGDGTLELSAANTFTGTTRVSNGIVRLSNNLALENSPLDLSGTGSIQLVGVTALSLGGLSGTTDLTTAITSGFGGVTALTLNTAASGSLTYSGAIPDGTTGMSLTKTGSGTQNLLGANTFTGPTTVSAGILRLGLGSAYGSSLSTSGTLILLQGGPAQSVVTGTISGAGAFGVGGGMVILSNAINPYTGRTIIESGTVQVSVLADTGVASSLGTPATTADATIDLGSGTAVGGLRYVGTGDSTNRPIFLAGSSGGGGSLDASGSGPVSFLGGVTGNAGTTLTLAGSNSGANYITAITGSNVVKTGPGTWVFGTNSFTGRLTIEQGTIVAALDAPGGSGTTSSLGRQNGPIPLLGLADASGTAALLAANGVTISRVIEVAALGSGSQEVVLGGSGAGEATFDANSAFRLGRGVTLAADPGGNVRFLTPTNNWDQQDGSADPAVAVTIGTPTATGTVTLETTLPNSITAVTVRQGTLRLGNGTTVGALGPASVLTGSAGATLAFNRSDTISSGAGFAATIGGAMNVTQLGSGTVVLAGVNTYTGTTSIAAGTIRVSGSGRIASSAQIDVATGGRLEFARTDDYGGAYDGKLTGSGLLSVQSGSLTLTGLNTFAGSSEVLSGAVLQLDGQINNTSLDIASGATLMGSGTILGTTTIAGLHAPGSSPGIQTLGNLTYLSGASVEWELWSNTTLNTATPPDYDQILLTGNLDFAGATVFNLVFTGSAGPTNFSEVAWANSFWDSNREWLVYDVAGTTTGFGNLTLVQTNWQDSNGFSFNTVRSMASFRLEKRVSNDVYLVYNAIPEPGSLALAAIGLAAAAWHRRRRT